MIFLPLTFPLTLIPSVPEFVIFASSVVSSLAPFSIIIPFEPVFVTIKLPFVLFNNPVDAIKIPSPVLSKERTSPLLVILPDTLMLPFLFTSKVLPSAFNVLPETVMPFEPLFVISMLPEPKFFKVPATFVPPSAP